MQSPKTSGTASRRSLLGILCFFVLNLLLWLPAIWRRSDLFAIIPIPEQHLGRGIYDLALFYFARRPTFDLAHLSFDLVLLASIGWLAMLFVKREKVAKVLAVLFSFSLLYQVYFELVMGFQGRQALFREDIPLIKPAFHFLGDSAGWGVWFILALMAVAAFGFVRVLSRVWLFLFDVVAGISRSAKRFLAAGLLITIAYAQLCFYKYGSDRPDVIIRSSFFAAANNIQRSLHEPVKVQPSTDDAAWAAFARKDAPAPSELPDVYLMVLESYGQVVTDDPNLRKQYQPFMENMERQLKNQGWTMRTQMSESPVFGGGSWLSLASIHNGLWIPNQESFDALPLAMKQKSRLVDLLEGWGYETLGLMPGNRHEISAGVGTSVAYGYQEMLEWRDIPYRGEPNAYAWIPDQYSMGWTFSNRPLPMDRPRLFFFMSTNSHAPWKGTPPVLENWRDLDQLKTEAEKQPSWWKFLENFQSAVELTQQSQVDREAYLKSIFYEWNVVAENLPQISKRPSVVIVIGDHQPYFADPAHRTSPVHVLTSDPRMLSVLDKVQFGKSRSWRHDEITRLIVDLIRRDSEPLAHRDAPVDHSLPSAKQPAH